MAETMKIRVGQLPQEIEVWYVLPALRREFAKVLTKEHHITQKKVAELFNITEAAVSQYLSGKRATSVQFNPEILAEIRKAATSVLNEGMSFFTELERVSKLLTVKKVVCGMCHTSNEWIYDDCEICFE